MSVIVKGGGGKSSGLYVWKKYEVASLISFSMADANNVSYIVGTYQAEEGMTWEAFVNSSYSNGDFSVDGNYIRYKFNSSERAPNSNVSLFEKIRDGETYLYAFKPEGKNIVVNPEEIPQIGVLSDTPGII